MLVDSLAYLIFVTPTLFALAEQLGGDDTDTKKHRYLAMETICRKLDASFSNLGSSCFCCASATAGTTPVCDWCANSSGWHRCLRNVGEPMTSSSRAEHLSEHSPWFLRTGSLWQHGAEDARSYVLDMLSQIHFSDRNACCASRHAKRRQRKYTCMIFKDGARHIGSICRRSSWWKSK